jgi:hypothetical protein
LLFFRNKKRQQVDAGEVPKEKLRSNKLASNLAKKIQDILFEKADTSEIPINFLNFSRQLYKSSTIFETPDSIFFFTFSLKFKYQHLFNLKPHGEAMDEIYVTSIV